MIETYYLNTIIFFFKSQRDLDYVAIEDVLNVLDDTEIPDNIKRDMVLDILRFYGLNEMSYRNGRFSPACERLPAELWHEKVHEISYKIEAIRFPVINGSIGINIPLN